MIKTVVKLAKLTCLLLYNIAFLILKLAFFSVENMNIRLKVSKVYYIIGFFKRRLNAPLS